MVHCTDIAEGSMGQASRDKDGMRRRAPNGALEYNPSREPLSASRSGDSRRCRRPATVPPVRAIRLERLTL